MIPLYINVKSRVLHKNAYDVTVAPSIELRAGDTPVLNLYFMLPSRDPRAPYDITRFASSAITVQLLDSQNSAQASQAVWTEIVPATTAPTITRTISGTASVGEYDTIALASEPGSGFLGLVMSAGSITSAGATSATAKVYPGITQESEIVAAFASLMGAPYAVAFPSKTVIEIHGSAVATPPRITAVNVTNLGYLFGWTASLDLTGAGVAGIADYLGDTPQVSLAVKLTPSGGAAETVLKWPVNLTS